VSAEDAADHGPWWRDRAAWWPVLFAAWVRFVPMVMWPTQPCVRDECTYMKLAQRILDGEGLTAAAAGWLWAPGYPYLMALHQTVTGWPATVKFTQTVLFLAAMPLVYGLTRRALDQRAGRWVLWLLALSPTLIFFAVTNWSEVLYTAVLFTALAALGWSRRGGPARGLLPGLLVGVCVLFRGVATYMLPIFAVGLLWQRWRDRRAWAGAAAMVLAAVLTVAPYSVHATKKHGGLVVSDRTMGQMMWLGNNSFDPITFDWGNGTLTDPGFTKALRTGRKRCDKEMGPTAWDDCEREGGKAWIVANPGEFFARVPVRVAQLMNPHSFLTRHLRWNKWREIKSPVRDALYWLVILWSAIALLGGTIGACARGRGWLAVVTWGLVIYHVAAISLLAGLSRYRVPLDAIWMIWAAGFLSSPRASLAALRADPRRLGACIFCLVALIPLMAWYLPAGFQ
jgi:4-amino-4-deoxy-L-arabinose transferase-like glycosyltransferase